MSNSKIKIPFSTNWNNKLACSVFTTIRIHQPNKFKLGVKGEVTLRTKELGEVEIIGLMTVNATDLTEMLCYIDTGYSKKETLQLLEEMYKKPVAQIKVDVLFLKWSDRRPGAISYNQLTDILKPD